MLTGDAARDRPIGVFDSGVGGLSVWREIVRSLPTESVIYLADQARAPYGERSKEEVARYTHAAVAWLVSQGVKLVVIACNTASAAALDRVRARWPETPIVGMEPAVKPASQRTRTGHVGVLATPGTLQADRFSSLVERFANGVHVHTVMGTGLVQMVEQQKLDGPEVEARLQEVLAPVMAADIDHLVLGCTHYPFLAPALRRVLGDDVQLVDPAPAVARQTRRVLEKRHLQRTQSASGVWRFVTTGALTPFQNAVFQLVKAELTAVDRPILFQQVHF